MPVVDQDTIDQYTAAGFWGTETVQAVVRRQARDQPSGAAFLTASGVVTWSGYDTLADNIAGGLASAGVPTGARVAVLLPDDVRVHAALIGCNRAATVAVGIGFRAGQKEISHLMATTGASALITVPERAGHPVDALVTSLTGAGIELSTIVVVDDDLVARVRGRSHGPANDRVRPALGPNDLSILNSTSGTTGLPKCVTQFDNRWMYFSRLAIECGRLTADDVFFGCVPAPFGFGLWTSHYAPAVLGVPTVVLPRFDAGRMVRLIDQYRVTVLCCVSTQFRLLLRTPGLEAADLSSLRVMFTGGEAVPFDRALELEHRTGAKVLQFFGSNETGAFSATTLEDPAELRLTSAGRLLPQMDVRLYDEDGTDVTATGGPGRPAGRGPLTCAGYHDDPAANAQLYTPGGRMLMGDLVTVRDEVLTVVGRTSDLVIRGGKNISAPQVEAEVDAHPAVRLVAAVAVPDEVFGERVCAVVQLMDGAHLSLEELRAFLSDRGVSKELWPEHLLVVDQLPTASGGKVAKGQVRERAVRSLPG